MDDDQVTTTPPPATDPSPEAMALVADILTTCGVAGYCSGPPCACAAAVDAFRREGVEKAYKHCLQLADDMTNQRALIRFLMKEAGVEKFKRTTKCLVCEKNPREEDGGMLCQSCRDKVDSGASP